MIVEFWGEQWLCTASEHLQRRAWSTECNSAVGLRDAPIRALPHKLGEVDSPVYVSKVENYKEPATVTIPAFL